MIKSSERHRSTKHSKDHLLGADTLSTVSSAARCSTSHKRRILLHGWIWSRVGNSWIKSWVKHVAEYMDPIVHQIWRIGDHDLVQTCFKRWSKHLRIQHTPLPRIGSIRKACYRIARSNASLAIFLCIQCTNLPHFWFFKFIEYFYHTSGAECK